MAIHAEWGRCVLGSRNTIVVRFRESSRSVVAVPEGNGVDSSDCESVIPTWPEFVDRLNTNAAFRLLLNRTLSDLPFDFQWKPVPYYPSAIDLPFFFVAVPSRFREANPSSYREQIDTLAPHESVALFANLSGDATLLIPRDEQGYGHIAEFCKTAPETTMHAFWQAVGAECQRRIDDGEAFWCNTHGHGVPWFHLRFDCKLKYTAFPPNGEIDDSSQAEWYRIPDEAFAT